MIKGPEDEGIDMEEEDQEKELDEEKLEKFRMALVGIGQGGGNIIDSAMIKLENEDYKRYQYLKEVIGDRAWALNTGSELKKLRRRGNIPPENCIRIGTSAKGAGGRAGQGWKIFEERESTIDNVLKDIDNADPSVIVIAHSASGGTGGGGAPYFIKKAIDRFLLGKGERGTGRMSRYLYIISILPSNVSGQKFNAIYSLGKIYDIYEEAIEEDEDVAQMCLPLLMSNQQFKHSLTRGDTTFSDQETLFKITNPIPTDVLSQILYTYLGAEVAVDVDNESVYTPILDPADLIRAVSPKRPFTTVNIMDNVNKSDLEDDAKRLCEGDLEIRNPEEYRREKIEGDTKEIMEDIRKSVRNMNGVICKPEKPNVSRLSIIVFGNDIDIVNQQTVSKWKNILMNKLGFISDSNDEHDTFPHLAVAKTHAFRGKDTPGILTVMSGFVPEHLKNLLEEFSKEIEIVGWDEATNLTGTTEEELKQIHNNISSYCLVEEETEIEGEEE